MDNQEAVQYLTTPGKAEVTYEQKCFFQELYDELKTLHKIPNRVLTLNRKTNMKYLEMRQTFSSFKNNLISL